MLRLAPLALALWFLIRFFYWDVYGRKGSELHTATLANGAGKHVVLVGNTVKEHYWAIIPEL